MRAYFTRFPSFVNLVLLFMLLFSEFDTCFHKGMHQKVVTGFGGAGRRTPARTPKTEIYTEMLNVFIVCNISRSRPFIPLENGGKSSKIGPACISDPIISGGPICLPVGRSDYLKRT